MRIYPCTCIFGSYTLQSRHKLHHHSQKLKKDQEETINYNQINLMGSMFLKKSEDIYAKNPD